MSNYLAIASVTATFSNLLADAVPADMSGVEISTQRPDSQMPDGGSRINLYLYQVAPNPALRNRHEPTRRADGTLIQRPRVALDLYYMLSFYGNEEELVPQRLLGSVVSMLHAQPLLTQQRIEQTIRSATELDSEHYLADSDLAQQIERVRLTAQPMNLDELSKLWSMLVYNAQYVLSLVYQASVVLIEGPGIPTRALPVHGLQALTKTFRQPQIERILPSLITAESTITIKGQHLQAERVRVRFGDSVSQIEATDDQLKLINDQRIEVVLPDALRAGVNSAQVIHSVLDDGVGFESNVSAFVLRPTITAMEVFENGDERSLLLEFNPQVVKQQRVVLLLNQLGSGATGNAPPRAYSMRAPDNNGITGDSTEETDMIEFPITVVEPGTYLVRVQVDGAESPLTRDSNRQSPTFNRYIGPKVRIP